MTEKRERAKDRIKLLRKRQRAREIGRKAGKKRQRGIGRKRDRVR